MAQTAMTVRLDDQLKESFDALCNQFGMSANTAINVFIRQVVRTRQIPFPISASEVSTRQRALNALYQNESFAEMGLEEINAEISKVRAERTLHLSSLL